MIVEKLTRQTVRKWTKIKKNRKKERRRRENGNYCRDRE